jgi:hypothetical protein
MPSRPGSGPGSSPRGGSGSSTSPRTTSSPGRARFPTARATRPIPERSRTSWVFGPGRNFPLAILDQAQKRRSGEAEGPLTVVDDQHGAPTFAEDLAFALLAIARQDEDQWGGGLLHLRNGGETTWYAFAREILDQAGFGDVEIEPVPSSTFETAARRPLFSVLDCRWAESKGIVMPSWKDALSRYLAGPDCPYELAATSADSAADSSHPAAPKETTR